jgi:hypothetical protein
MRPHDNPPNSQANFLRAKTKALLPEKVWRDILAFERFIVGDTIAVK